MLRKRIWRISIQFILFIELPSVITQYYRQSCMCDDDDDDDELLWHHRESPTRREQDLNLRRT